MNRSDSARSRPFSTRTTAGLRLSYRIRPGTPPKCSNARTWPSRNASWAWVPNATWNARPECDSRITNIQHFTVTPADDASNSPKSTSASAPGRWVCGIDTSPGPDPSSTRRRRHVPRDRHLRRPSRRARRPGAARPAGRYGAASAARPVRRAATRRSPRPRVDRRPRRAGYALRGGGTAPPTPGAPFADAPHAARPAPGSTAPPGAGPAGSLEQLHP